MASARKPIVVGYVRVSTDVQAEQGYGLDVQCAAIQDWCRASGFALHSICSDEGVSGSNGLDTRVRLAEAMAVVADGGANGIVVYRLDRLARDLVLQETLLAELRRSGGELYSTSPSEAGYLSDDPQDPSRKLIRQVLGAVSEYERSMITLRLRAGRRRKALGGGFAYGSPPFGATSVDGVLRAHHDEQQVLQKMRELAAGGVSFREIARRLNDQGVAAKRVGARWHPTTVARVLKRDRLPSKSG